MPLANHRNLSVLTKYVGLVIYY